MVMYRLLLIVMHEVVVELLPDGRRFCPHLARDGVYMVMSPQLVDGVSGRVVVMREVLKADQGRSNYCD